MKIKYFALLIAILSIFTNCSQEPDTNVCNVENPLEDIDWLNKIAWNFSTNMGPQKQRISQYEYGGETVFLIESCFQCDNVISMVYDCEQNLICEFGELAEINTCPDFEDNASNEIILFDR